MNAKFSSVSFAVFLAPAVTFLVVAASFFQPDKAIYVLAIPMGLLLILATWQAPHLVALFIVALIPMGTFAELSETMRKITLFKLLFFFPFSVLVLGLVFRRFELLPLNTMDKWIVWWIMVNIFLIFSSLDKGQAVTFCRRLLSLAFFYFMLTRLFYRTDRFDILIRTIILSTLPSVIIGFGVYLSGNNLFFSRQNLRVTGASGIGPGSYTASLFLPIWLAVSVAMSARKRSMKMYIYYTFAIIIAAVIPLTLSRSGALVFAILFFLAIIVWRKKLTSFHYGTLVAGLLIGMMFIPQSFWERSSRLSQMGDVNISDGSLWRRINYLEVGLNIVKDYPILGAGPGNFRRLHADPRYQKEISLIGMERLPHNMYMQAITETGILGIIFFTGFIISIIITTLGGLGDEHMDGVARGLLLALLGLLLMGMFSHILLTKYFWLTLSLIRILPEVVRYHSQAEC
ncbi:O-antigen ligase family protein [Desulfonema magnum]|uniref:O-antigen ligase-related domain-containing protein n=1 Tax=Desulfonema magnum TaxID=45655 RepID=A0A975GRC1_9BACT|nr:O-antigen ligase family protein [Desulfonema magnum]QTA90750.1 O-antigen ligase-related domain-containing protein [Desulfonema magnum]